MLNPTATLLLPIWALANLIIMINGSESLHPVLSGPTLAYLRTRAVFRCVVSGAPPPVTYELLKDQSTPISSGTDLQGDQPALFFLKVDLASGGLYHCKTKADNIEGVSNSIRLTVVIPPLETRITSEPFPPMAYEGSRLVLCCNVSRGSHLSYSWFFNRREVLPSSSPLLRSQGNSLVIDRVQPEHEGPYYCMAWSTVQDIKRFSSSREVHLTVKVYVTKPQLSLAVSKEAGGGLVGNISCSVSRGSPPINFTLLLDDRAEGTVTGSGSLSVWFCVSMVPGLEMGRAHMHYRHPCSPPRTPEPDSLDMGDITERAGA
ncbi:Fc receptor-like protein 5 [Boleophthalmus pectinirostris]|uniref:Fc receptor-like protein 5 n=1 Tax=Boleophthalmus pectinirostris TaxID=150288 RepID=UPI00242E17C6|nr:Fc receptor-like protein 5 [Boleophthalmus pectinirostris]